MNGDGNLHTRRAILRVACIEQPLNRLFVVADRTVKPVSPQPR